MAADQNKSLSSANRITWEYFTALRRLVSSAQRASDPNLGRQDTALAIMAAITLVEAFLNLFFRVKTSEPGFEQHASIVLRDLSNRKSLDYKLKHWPRQVLGKPLDVAKPAVAEFMLLKARRNALMHFTSSHETAIIDNIEIRGLADTTVYDGLVATDAVRAVSTAEGMIAALFRLAGFTEDQIPPALHLWLGKVPASITN